MMNRQDHLKFCKICQNRQLNPQKGIICGLTMEVANFDPICPDFKLDEDEQIQVQIKQQQAQNITKERSGLYLVFLIFATAVSGFMSIMGALGLFIAFTNEDAYEKIQEASELGIGIEAIFVLFNIIQFVSIVLIWLWKKIGVYGYVGIAVITIIANIILGTQWSAIAWQVFVTSLIVFITMISRWEDFD
jgi:hypothetical protein